MSIFKRRNPGQGKTVVEVPEAITSSEAATSPFVLAAQPEELKALHDAGKLIEMPAGMLLFEDSAPGDYCIFLLSGRLDVIRGRAVVASVTPGWYAGEMSIVQSEPRNATVVAGADSTGYLIDRTEFEILYTTCRTIRAHVDITLRVRLAAVI